MKAINGIFALIFIFCTLLFLPSCLKEELILRPYAGFTPIANNDGWISSTPSSEQMDSIELDKIFQDLYTDQKAWMIKNMTVIRKNLSINIL